MSSGISTDNVRLKPDTPSKPHDPDARGVRVPPSPEASADRRSLGGGGQADQGLQAWQFFVLAALGCATAGTFMARGQGVTAVVLISALMGVAAFVGLTALRMVQPLVCKEEDRTPVVGQRTRAALEREKTLALRAIKELEFDRAMGKLAEEDWKEMSSRLRARAARLMRELDAGAGYRGQIEHDLAAKIAELDAHGAKASTVGRVCSACSTANDQDASFCKRCGQPIG